MISLIG